MAFVDDGIRYGLASLKFQDQLLGLIDEDAVDWGGSDPEILKIWAAQDRTAPVKEIVKTDAVNELKLNLIELKADNIVAVMGGTKAADGSWEAPKSALTKEGSVEITTSDGTVITIPRASLYARFKGKINFSEVLKIEITLTILKPTSADTAPFKITPPTA